MSKKFYEYNPDDKQKYGEVTEHLPNVAREHLRALGSGDRELALRCSRDLAQSLYSEPEVEMELNFHPVH